MRALFILHLVLKFVGALLSLYHFIRILWVCGFLKFSLRGRLLCLGLSELIGQVGARTPRTSSERKRRKS
jgi:hypothetical protein